MDEFLQCLRETGKGLVESGWIVVCPRCEITPLDQACPKCGSHERVRLGELWEQEREV